MSDDIPERSDMIRSTVITVVFTAVFTIIALTLWAWESLPEDELSPLDALNDLNPYITLLIEALVILGFFIFLCVTLINLRMFFSEVRAGWLEVISVFILAVVMAWLMFGNAVGGVSAIFCLGFVVYLYLLQD